MDMICPNGINDFIEWSSKQEQADTRIGLNMPCMV